MPQRFLASLVLLLTLATACVAQEGKPLAVTVEDTPKFFKMIFDSKEPRPKGDFETDEEYRQRTENALDTNKVYYFRVNRRQLLGAVTKDMYSYDIQSGDLVISAGEYLSEKADKKSPYKSVPFCLQWDIHSGKDYEATNGFGAKVNVKASLQQQYVLNIFNCNEFERKNVDYRKHLLSVSLNQPDRDEAKRLSQEAEIVIGVQLKGIKDMRRSSDYERPTFRDPNEVVSILYSVDASLVEIMMVDSKNDMLLKVVKAKGS
jgi:hypothetical protein